MDAAGRRVAFEKPSHRSNDEATAPADSQSSYEIHDSSVAFSLSEDDFLGGNPVASSASASASASDLSPRFGLESDVGPSPSLPTWSQSPLMPLAESDATHVGTPAHEHERQHGTASTTTSFAPKPSPSTLHNSLSNSLVASRTTTTRSRARRRRQSNSPMPPSSSHPAPQAAGDASTPHPSTSPSINDGGSLDFSFDEDMFESGEGSATVGTETDVRRCARARERSPAKSPMDASTALKRPRRTSPGTASETSAQAPRAAAGSTTRRRRNKLPLPAPEHLAVWTRNKLDPTGYVVATTQTPLRSHHTQAQVAPLYSSCVHVRACPFCSPRVYRSLQGRTIPNGPDARRQAAEDAERLRSIHEHYESTSSFGGWRTLRVVAHINALCGVNFDDQTVHAVGCSRRHSDGQRHVQRLADHGHGHDHDAGPGSGTTTAPICKSQQHHYR